MDVPLTDQRMEIQSSRHSGIRRYDGMMDSGIRRYDGKMDSGFRRNDDKMDSGFRRNDDKMDSGFRRNGKRVLERQFVLTTGPSWRVASCS